jgi:hypothetical protein
MKKLLIALFLLLPLPAYAQKTKAALNTEISTSLASGTGITASTLRGTLTDMVNSWYDLAGGTSLTCSANQFVNGLPTLSSLNCAQPSISNLSGFGTGVLAALGTNVGSAGAPVLFNGAGGTPTGVVLTNGTGLPIAGTTGWGTGVAAALAVNTNASGGFCVLSPTRPGDIMYWNGTACVALAGNNSGTQVFSENASGVPAWLAASGAGTVISVTCFGTAITTSGTCATAATKSDEQTGSSTTAVVTPSQQQQHDSAAKAWVNFVGSSGTINASYNVTSVTRASAGSYTVNFTTAFANNAYACTGSAEDSSTNEFIKMGTTGKTTSVLPVLALSSFSATADPANVSVVCFGRQ